MWTRQAVFGITLGNGGWDVPVAALTLYDEVDESLRMYARSVLGSWLARKAPSAGKPTREQADRLRGSLERADVSAALKRHLRFHGSL